MAGTPEGGRAPEPVRRRLAALLVGRLAVAVAILAAGLLLTARGEAEGAEGAARGLVVTAVLTFLATIGFAGWYARVRQTGRFTAAQVAVDVALVTALVHFTGGAESAFAFLYVPITVYAALLSGRTAAYAVTALAAAAYGGLLVANGLGWLGEAPSGAAPAAVQLALWGVHAAALLLVAFLSSALARERDRAGRALHERTRDLRSLQQLHARTVESLTSGLLTTDAALRITSFNPEAERITAFAAAEVQGRALEDVIPGAEPLVRAPLRERGARQRIRLRFRSRDGRDLYLGLAGSPLRGPAGGTDGYVVIFQDVTEVVEMEGELRLQERMAAIGQLAAHLAHEIRNPLASISGSVQVLGAEPAVGATEGRRLMEIVLRETERLDRLITDFLQYARPAPPRREAVGVAAVASEVLRMFEASRPASVAVESRVPTDLRVFADEGQLRQVLWNLVRNAVEAMPDGGCLRLDARALPPQEGAADVRNGTSGASGWAEIEVADTGVGIAEELLDRVFDPFFTTKKEGTGLGLATVHRVVEGSGGTLGVESTPGRGARFRIRLPLAKGTP